MIRGNVLSERKKKVKKAMGVAVRVNKVLRYSVAAYKPEADRKIEVNFVKNKSKKKS